MTKVNQEASQEIKKKDIFKKILGIFSHTIILENYNF